MTIQLFEWPLAAEAGAPDVSTITQNNTDVSNSGAISVLS